MKKVKLTKISVLHYVKLVYRSLLFIAAALVYIFGHINHISDPFANFERDYIVLSIIWIVFVVEMILRFIPSDFESMGCQKQFARNYKPTNYEGDPHLTPDKTTIEIGILWLLMNGIFGALYLTGVFDRGIMLLIALAYSVCDVVCILFFCPFQTWFMKNKCCGSCRIYNWDYAMMMTPLVFVPRFYTYSLVAFSVVLLIRWEWTYHHHHKERFSEATNECLSCKNCPEKLCHHKVQLQHFLKENKHLLKFNENLSYQKARMQENAEHLKENIQNLKDEIKNKKGK